MLQALKLEDTSIRTRARVFSNGVRSIVICDLISAWSANIKITCKRLSNVAHRSATLCLVVANWPILDFSSSPVRNLGVLNFMSKSLIRDKQSLTPHRIHRRRQA